MTHLALCANVQIGVYLHGMDRGCDGAHVAMVTCYLLAGAQCMWHVLFALQ